MITLTVEPPSIPDVLVTTPKQPPVPISDCIRWCLQPDASDGISTPGSKATVTINFPLSTTIPADGTPFKIWGYDFEVNSAEDFTSTSFKVESLGFTTWLNFANMILANLFFNRAVTLAGGLVGSELQVIIVWNDCREQPRFTVENMDLSGVEATGATTSFANGVSPVYVEAYRMVARVGVHQDATQVLLPLSVLEGLEADKQCSAIGEVCIDYRGDIETQLFTMLPELTSTSRITPVENGRSLMRLFSIQYGWTYRENCQAKSGTIKTSDYVLCINAAFGVDDPYQIRRYWYDHPDGFPPGQTVPDFLTTQPKTMSLCLDSFAWLWLLNNWQNEFGVNYLLVAKFSLYKNGFDGVFETFDFTVMNPVSDGNGWYQAVNFNVSPAFVIANAPTITASELVGFSVQVFGKNTGGTTLFTASETLKYEVGHCCPENTDLYFLTPAGGIATQVVTIDEREVTQEGQEIFLNVACSTSRFDRARYGASKLVSLKSFEEVTISLSLPSKEENIKWLRHLRQSPQHWLRVKDEAGLPIAKKFLLNPGSIKTFSNGEATVVKAKGFFAEIPTQKGIEPL